VDEKLPARAKEILHGQRQQGEDVSGKKVLVVDDDVRNIFAITSVLESHGLDVLYAENGRDGSPRWSATPTWTWC